MRGQSYPSECIRFSDPRSGVAIVQLTSQQRMSWNMYFEHNNFTPDSRTVLLWRQRQPQPEAPADVYRCDLDGCNMTCLTDEEGVYGVSLSPDGRYVCYLVGTTFKRADVRTGAAEKLLAVPNAQPGSMIQSGQSGDGRYVFATLGVGDRIGLFRLAADGSEAALLVCGHGLGHVKCDPKTGTVCYVDAFEGRRRWRAIDAQGGEPRDLLVQRFHTTSWLGSTGRLQGCLSRPARSIVTMAEGDARPRCVAAGPGFWHSGASLDGEWIAADTIKPDEGLMLVHAPTGAFTFLCHSGSSNDHEYQSHPHPAVSPDGSVVVFTSNRTGVPQVYAALVPEGMREALRHSFDWEGYTKGAGQH